MIELLNLVLASLVFALVQLSKEEKSDPLAGYSALFQSCASRQALNFQTETNNEIMKCQVFPIFKNSQKMDGIGILYQVLQLQFSKLQPRGMALYYINLIDVR